MPLISAKQAETTQSSQTPLTYNIFENIAPEEEVVTIASGLIKCSLNPGLSEAHAFGCLHKLNGCFLRAKTYEQCGSLAEAALAGRTDLLPLLTEMVASGEPPSVVALGALQFMVASKRIRAMLVEAGFIPLLLGVLKAAANATAALRAAAGSFRAADALWDPRGEADTMEESAPSGLAQPSWAKIQDPTDSSPAGVTTATTHQEMQIAKANNPLRAGEEGFAPSPSGRNIKDSSRSRKIVVGEALAKGQVCVSPQRYSAAVAAAVAAQRQNRLNSASPVAKGCEQQLYVSGLSLLTALLVSSRPINETKGSVAAGGEPTGRSTVVAPPRGKAAPPAATADGTIGNAAKNLAAQAVGDSRPSPSLLSTYGGEVVRVAAQWLWSEELACRAEALVLLGEAVVTEKGLKAFKADVDAANALVFAEEVEPSESSYRRQARSIRRMIPALCSLMLPK